VPPDIILSAGMTATSRNRGKRISQGIFYGWTSLKVRMPPADGCNGGQLILKGECPMAALQIKVNGQSHTVDESPATPLLWVLRDNLRLTVTRFGCGLAHCAACPK
jgi:hypothetical protein